MSISEAFAEALDAIGDDPDYATARAHLLDAHRLLLDGTTADVQHALNRGLAAIDATCPI